MGDKFRIRARQFPALVNCTQFDWFHGWPPEALISVAQKFLTDIPDIEEPIREKIALHMSFAHQEVTEASRRCILCTARLDTTETCGQVSGELSKIQLHDTEVLFGIDFSL